jgi:uncharacterized membrane protein YphA (DoxX/SURF4 family)
MYFSIAGLPVSLGQPMTLAPDLIAALGGILLLAGLWTPVAGVGIALDELWIAFSHTAELDDLWTHILLAALGAGLAMLGPGAWSVDALLFGRRRVDITDRTRGR